MPKPASDQLERPPAWFAMLLMIILLVIMIGAILAMADCTGLIEIQPSTVEFTPSL